ncbi:hypothetical protein EV191_12541 [Tamaricihabitans halophyticus]|uniref:Nudix hydrolase domain-containing protein n=2 Tax=Tamaricihabitans halophyticus TaxID=1262583 RepID=A0A4V2SR49_9PSEU|nr:hypothetical protein EV191_12541 [Tamaricihabitans halophyticus]
MLTIIAAVLVCALLLGAWLIGTANRLMRLHVRTDAAWAAAEAALGRRAVVARAVAAAGLLPETEADALRAAAERAESVPREEREQAENELTRLLGLVQRSALPAELVEELGDAEQRVVIARRVHNDAVRDTLTQRRRRVVRWCRLAGTAAQPSYLEIAEPELTGQLARYRRSARVLLVDAGARVLLFNGHDPARKDAGIWFTVGGEVEAGEELRGAACRELREETGLELSGDRLVGPVWRRRAQFPWDGELMASDEWFFLAHLRDTTGETVPAEALSARIDTSGFTAMERDSIDGHRWWTLPQLRDTDETVYPEQLAVFLPPLLDNGWDGRLRAIS